jgi:tetratricopeptide (TPR) repeat protein
LIIITFFVCKYFRKYPYLPVGWFWFIGTLVPVIGIVQIGEQTMADRYVYVPAIGLFVIIAWGIKQISSKDVSFKKPFIFITVLIIILLTLATHNQVKLWSNTVTLFEDTLKKDPNNYVAYALLGQAMFVKGDNEKALYYYDKALKLTPRIYAAYKNKGVVLMKMGKRDEAIKIFKNALKLDKYSVDAYYSLSLLYLDENNLDECIKYALKAIAMKPDYEDGYNILGVALLKKGQIHESILQFEKALQINPYDKNSQKNLQIALERRNRNTLSAH